MTELDLKRCQNVPVRVTRCDREPIIIETRIADDPQSGVRASRSLCRRCWSTAVTRNPPGYATFEPIGKEQKTARQKSSNAS